MSSRAERGAILVELVMTISILGFVSAALAESLFVALRTTETTVHRVAESGGAQFVSSTFVMDVQSSTRISETPCGADPAAVTFEQLDPDPADALDDTARVVSYVVGPPVGDGRELIRLVCDAADLNAPAERRVLARELALESPVTVTVDCDGACPDASEPKTVTAKVTGAAGYRYELTGTRRLW